jgi:hypothetical protein
MIPIANLLLRKSWLCTRSSASQISQAFTQFGVYARSSRNK